jgi:3-hydroxyacyl-CoA dehydrogenase/enoyl-CoA hydratase/3-hydroxybutyryl-CoA epimerase
VQHGEPGKPARKINRFRDATNRRDIMQEFKHWQLQRDAEGIAWLTIDRAGETTNTLSREVLEELDRALDELQREVPSGLVIQSGKASGFIAGADIREFESFTDAASVTAEVRRGHAVFSKLENLTCHTVAAVSGFCLGGGYELALCCNYIVAMDSDDTRVGLPEVKLGIVPGLGGTVRLSERVGGMNGMTAMLTGKLYRARQARGLGMIDEIVSPHGNLHWAARRAVLQKRKPRRAGLIGRLSNSGLARDKLAAQMVKKTAAKANPAHYPAPFKLIDHWKDNRGDRNAMFNAEAELIGELMVTPAAGGLQRVFHLMERLKGLGKGEQFTCRRVHVIGAGVMGGDIAAWCALQGMEVTVQDREMKYIEPAIARAKKLFKRKTRSKHAADATMARFIADVEGKGVARADVIIEAIFENVEAKQALYKTIEPKMHANAVLATNTSAIPLETLSSALESPSRLIGLHFFNPVAKMPLVEVVHADNTDAAMVARGNAFCGQINRFPVPVKSSPGFLVNRVLAPYMLEAMKMFDEGQSKEAIDAAALHFGMPMGPIELADTVGLDVGLSVVQKLGGDGSAIAVERLQKMVDEGVLGKKTGRGFYEWTNGKPVKEEYEPDDDIEARAERLLKPFLNECKACSEEGIVEDDDLLDAGIIFGTGFAPFRGGPMHYLAGQST